MYITDKMQNEQNNRKLTGLKGNKKILLKESGFSSIYAAQKELNETDNKKIYKHLLQEYNAAVDEIRANQQRLADAQKRAESVRRKEATRVAKNTRVRAVRVIQREQREMIKKYESLFEEFTRTGNITVPINLNYISLNSIIAIIIKATKGKNALLKVGDTTYALNDSTRIRLARYIEDQITSYEQTVESNGEVVCSITQASSFTLTIFVPNAHKRANHNGAFFKYTNNTDIDLSRQGVFNHFDVKNYEDTCIVYALKMAGVEKDRLDKIRAISKNRNIPLKDIPLICEKLEICIAVKKIDTTEHQDRHVYGKEYAEKEKYWIGLIDNHYFLIEPISITSYAVANCIKLKKLLGSSKYHNIISFDQKKNKYTTNNKRFVDTFVVMNAMFEHRETHLTEILYENSEIASTQFYNRVDGKITNLGYTDAEVKPMVLEEKPKDDSKENKNNKEKKPPVNVFFDFETFVKQIDGRDVHIPYLCCATYPDGTTRSFYGEDSGRQLLNSLTQNTRLIAHNATYDYRFVIKYMYALSEIGRGTKMISCKGRFGDFDIIFKDSYHLISMPLKKFGKTFALKSEKEIMPYALYNETAVAERFMDIDAALDFVKQEDKEQFLANIDRWNLHDDSGKKYDILEYSRKYCEIDCIVLKQGYNTFREWILTDFQMDINEVLTLASLMEKILIAEHCYDDIYKLSGVPQRFIQNCVVGGRTMVANNEKNSITERVQDFDAVSLYPSAMIRMPGFLRGTPKVITNFDAIKNTADGFFAEVVITKVAVHRSMPLISYMNENGVRMFSNNIIGKTVFIDSVSLDDAVKYQGVEYNFVRGYYYDEGFNAQINITMKKLFDIRVQKKAEKNPSEIVYKLLMNTGYGKTIIKAVDTETRMFDDQERLDVYLSRNYSWVKCYTKMDGTDKVKVETVKTTVDHFNLPHIGVMILAWSKRIMNEVICLAEDNAINVYYQDTDSMHIDENKISTLSEKYSEMYGKELIGKGVGQFHSDFDFDGHTDVVAVRSIFLGKKSYIDELEGKCEKTGAVHKSYHIRLKGVPNESIMFACARYNCSPFDLYERMYKGEKVNFDLTCGGGKVNFKFNKDFSVHTQSVFNRSLIFLNEKEKK